MEPTLTRQTTKPELLGYYPSEHITGTMKKNKATDWYMSEYAMKFMFENLRQEVANDPQGDVDGQKYEIEWSVYHIEALHHFACEDREGGDSYMGHFETYSEVVRDELEIVEVWDTIKDKSCPWLVERMNKFATRNIKQHV